MAYDSTQDTLKHINKVREKLTFFRNALKSRAVDHDRSKLGPEEKPIFDKSTPRLRDTTYGSEEYNDSLKKMGKALEHHYAVNRHHPEYFENGIAGMNLVDIVEMFCDWLAATERHASGDIYKSIEINQKRFNFSDDLKQIFINTAKVYEHVFRADGHKGEKS